MLSAITIRAGWSFLAALRPVVVARRLGCVLCGAVLQTACAQYVSFNATLPTPVSIPDNSTVGTVQSLSVDGIAGAIENLQVQLDIQSQGGGSMYNGDLYVTLVHDGTSVVLLNRVGRRAGFSAGYADAGFNINLSDSALADVHSYRVSLNGNDFIPLSSGDTPGLLTGTWQPDGRTDDPEAVVTTSPRTTSLSLFTGASANGRWSLFLSDLSPGASAVLVGWGLEINPVPEPAEIAFFIGLSLIAWGTLRRRQR